MMTTTEVNRLKSQIDKAILDMEELLPTPSGRGNTGAVAVRYWFYNWVERQIEGKLRKVTKEAVAIGVIFDHKKNPEAPFTDRSVYADDTVEIRVAVNAPGTRLDMDLLRFLLTDGGYIDQGTLEGLITKATKVNAPAHRFTATLIEGDRETQVLPRDTLY